MSINPPGPLAYEGSTPIPFLMRSFDPPNPSAVPNQQFTVPTIWLNSISGGAWILTLNPLGAAFWLKLGTAVTPTILELIGNSGAAYANNLGQINLVGDGKVLMTGNGLNTLTASLAVPVATINGGTGQTTYTDGQLLIGNSITGSLSLATLIQGPNITITNGNGTIEIQANGGGVGGIQTINTIAPAVGDFSITSSDSSVTITPGVASIDLTVVGGGGSGFTSIKRQVFTGAGVYTYTPAVDTPGMLYCDIELLGGGGGGGGCELSGGGTGVAAGGGGAGGYSKRVCDSATIGATAAVTIGAGGLGGAAGANPGNPGGTSTFVSASSVTLLSPTGGSGGIAGTPSQYAKFCAGGAGGAGRVYDTFGSYVTQGNAGTGGFSENTTTPTANIALAGMGGSTMYGGTPVQVGFNGTGSAAGNDATSFGAGGGGAVSCITPSSAEAGGNGAAGICIITAYCA